MKKNFLLLFLIAFVGFAATAQRSTRAKDADYSFLKGEKKINVIFSYEGMTVGKNKTEETYVEEKVAEKNEKKAGDGDRWRESWENGKLNIYEPMFNKGFDKKLEKLGLATSEGDDARLTLIVKTTRMEPGFNIGITKMSAQADYEFIFVETANHDNIVAQIVMSKVGGSDTYAVSDRVKVCYLGAGRRLAGYIYKALK
jgi:hypothetical protein